MKKYSIKFKEAVKRSRKLGLNEGETYKRYKQNYSHEKLGKSAIARYTEMGWTTADLSQNCGHAHAEIYHLLDSFGEQVYLTIGNVVINGKHSLKVTPEALVKELEKGECKGLMNMHVWLTLPDMSIMDFTIRPNQDLNNNVHSDIESSIIYLRPDEVDQDHYYEPMLVGAEYLQRIGVYQFSSQKC
jgi:hypothetical protein